MQLGTILKTLGILLILFSLTLIPPFLVELYYQDGDSRCFGAAFFIIILAGISIWFPFKNKNHELRARDGFLIAALYWTMICIAGALPIYFAPYLSVTFIEAIFESTSGFTTTGATVLTNLDYLPHTILYYRQQLQLFGGIGIIILAVAILPMLGVGGMQLFRTESTGPIKDNKLTPRIAQTAKGIWVIYLSLTFICFCFYWLEGMAFFDALCYSFSTIATGGFAPHDASFGYFEQVNIKATAIIFMIISSISYNLHFLAFNQKKGNVYRNDPECRFFIKLLIFSSIIVASMLLISYQFKDYVETVIDSIFQVVSIMTTTGFTTTDFSIWPSFIPLMLLFLGTIGGCAGSTTGGLKVIRLMLLQKQGAREIHRLIHPHGRYVIKVGNQPVHPHIIEGVWSFLSIYILIFTVLLLLMLLTEGDLMTAYSALISAISNIGPGLGEVALHYGNLKETSKLILCVTMLLGRLEIFTVIVLFSPAFWRA